jgi:hypothetical protein
VATQSIGTPTTIASTTQLLLPTSCRPWRQLASISRTIVGIVADVDVRWMALLWASKVSMPSNRRNAPAESLASTSVLWTKR